MKTIVELYEEILRNEDLKSEFASNNNEEDVLAFFKSHGVEVTKEEIEAFLAEKFMSDETLSDEELEMIAGGKGNNAKPTSKASAASLGLCYVGQFF